MIDRSIPPLIGSFPDNINIQEAELHQLTNGVPLFTLRAGTQSVVKVDITFPTGGNAYEDKLGQSLFVNKLLSSGTIRKSSVEISEVFASYGVQIETQPSFDRSGISIYCMEKYVKNVFPLLLDIITQPNFPEDELVREKELQITNLNIQHQKTGIVASKAFRKALFSTDHPYGKSLSEDGIRALSREDLQYFHKQNFGNCELLISGLFSDETLEFVSSMIQDTSLSYSGVDSRGIVPLMNNRERDTISLANSVQSSIRLGKRVIGKNHDDYIKLLITNHVLGGYFGSRLMKNIREEKGLTYGIYSSIVNLEKASYLVIAADVKNDLVDLALKEIYSEIEQLRNQHVPEMELERVKSHLLGSFQSDLNSAFALASKFKSIHHYGLGYNYYTNYLETIRKISSKEILDMANKYLKVEEISEIVVGG